MSRAFNKLIVLFFVFGLLFLLVPVFRTIPFGKDKAKVAKFYLKNAVSTTGSVNVVTSVVLGFRGFDTLGEVMVLFIASVGLGLVFSEENDSHRDDKVPASIILRVMSKLLLPFIMLFGVYIFLHGHLSPGGGFPAGAVFASGFLFLYLSQTGSFNQRLSQKIESLSGLVFVLVGLGGLYFSGVFLYNFLPLGEAGNLFSGGIIPVLYSFIGIKVGSELGAVIYHLLEG